MQKYRIVLLMNSHSLSDHKITPGLLGERCSEAFFLHIQWLFLPLSFHIAFKEELDEYQKKKRDSGRKLIFESLRLVVDSRDFSETLQTLCLIIVCFSKLIKTNRSPACQGTFANLTFLKLEWGTCKYLLTKPRHCQSTLPVSMKEHRAQNKGTPILQAWMGLGGALIEGQNLWTLSISTRGRQQCTDKKKYTQDCPQPFLCLPSKATTWEQVVGHLCGETTLD